jgi:hypothetical protein
MKTDLAKVICPQKGCVERSNRGDCYLETHTMCRFFTGEKPQKYQYWKNLDVHE